MPSKGWQVLELDLWAGSTVTDWCFWLELFYWHLSPLLVDRISDLLVAAWWGGGFKFLTLFLGCAVLYGFRYMSYAECFMITVLVLAFICGSGSGKASLSLYYPFRASRSSWTRYSSTLRKMWTKSVRIKGLGLSRDRTKGCEWSTQASSLSWGLGTHRGMGCQGRGFKPHCTKYGMIL